MGVGVVPDVEDASMVVDVVEMEVVENVEAVEDEDEDEEEDVVIVVILVTEAEIGIALEAVAGPIGKGFLTEADEADEMEAI